MMTHTADTFNRIGSMSLLAAENEALRRYLTGSPTGTVCAVDCPEHADAALEVFDADELAKDPANFSTVIDSDGIHVEGRRNLTAAQARSMARLLLQSARDLELMQEGE